MEATIQIRTLLDPIARPSAIVPYMLPRADPPHDRHDLKGRRVPAPTAFLRRASDVRQVQGPSSVAKAQFLTCIVS